MQRMADQRRRSRKPSAFSERAARFITGQKLSVEWGKTWGGVSLFGGWSRRESESRSQNQVARVRIIAGWRGRGKRSSHQGGVSR